MEESGGASKRKTGVGGKEGKTARGKKMSGSVNRGRRVREKEEKGETNDARHMGPCIERNNRQYIVKDGLCP